MEVKENFPLIPVVPKLCYTSEFPGKPLNMLMLRSHHVKITSSRDRGIFFKDPQVILVGSKVWE